MAGLHDQPRSRRMRARPERHRLRAGIALLACLALGACELPRPRQAASKVPRDTAVIDLEAVAHALGRDVTLREELRAASETLSTRLSELAADLRDRLEEEKGKLGERPSEQAQEEFLRVANEARAELQRGQTLARQRAQQVQSDLANRFRAEVLPVAQRIAAERGARVILVTSSVLWFDPSTDMTEAVVAAMGGAAAAPPTSR
jgi:Skp family chaperone for outer membrane proteins